MDNQAQVVRNSQSPGWIARILNLETLMDVRDDNGDEKMPVLSWPLAIGIMVIAVAAITVVRWYQQNYSFTVGLDYFEPEFQTYWMNLFYAQIILITLFGLVATAYAWFTRPAEITITPHKELSYYMVLFSALAGAGVIAPVAVALFVEADAAWHQVTIRDTDFTPTHILLFYGLIPAGLAGGVAGFVWLHTRMPDFRNRISFNMALAISGFLLIMPNLGFNEWGHTFFYAEELFAAPIHWGFVTLGWASFAIGGLIVQMLLRVQKLTLLIEKDKAEARV